MKHRSWMRRSTLPQPRLQLRLAGAFAGLCALSLVAQALVLATELSKLADALPSGGLYLSEALPGTLARTLAISALLVLPSLLLIGIRMTFRIAGPMFRFERYLEAVARGERPGPCQIRRTDELQEFCAKLNAALESARAQGVAEGTAPGESRRAAG